jgi:hypothetical protein
MSVSTSIDETYDMFGARPNIVPIATEICTTRESVITIALILEHYYPVILAYFRTQR